MIIEVCQVFFLKEFFSPFGEAIKTKVPPAILWHPEALFGYTAW